MFVEVVSRCRVCTLGFCVVCLDTRWALVDLSLGRFSIVCSRGQEECNIDESNLMNEIGDSFTIVNY